MLREGAINAIKTLIDVADEAGDGSIQSYFNCLIMEENSIFDIIHTVIEYDKLCKTGCEDLAMDETVDKLIVLLLVCIWLVLLNDQNARKRLDKIICDTKTKKLKYSTYIKSIIDSYGKTSTDQASNEGFIYYEGCKLTYTTIQ